MAMKREAEMERDAEYDSRALDATVHIECGGTKLGAMEKTDEERVR
tara:strand:+ start:19531 stop:19668 length:138 start_codon:yes stop_codon:yes gene_type:complete